MAARNDVTGDAIQTKGPSKAYRDNWDAIFGKKKEVVEEVLDTYNDERLVSKFDKDGKTMFQVEVGDLPVDEAKEFIEDFKKSLDNDNKQ